MPQRHRIVAMILALVGLTRSWVGLAQAEETGPVALPSGLRYEFLARWDVDRSTGS